MLTMEFTMRNFFFPRVILGVLLFLIGLESFIATMCKK